MLFGARRIPAPSRPGPLARRVLTAAALLLAGCTSTDLGSNDPVTIPTAITIDPAFFLGDVRCSSEPGSMRSYVATLIDWGEENQEEGQEKPPFTLASAPPTPCTSRVSFHFVAEGHQYTAVVDGYEQPASDLEPLGGDVSGSRHLLALGPDAVPVEVAPRWKPDPDCEAARAGAVAARAGTNVIGAVCALLDQSTAPVTTAITVDPASALGNLLCGVDVASLGLLPDDSALAPVLGIACDPATPIAPIVYDLGISPGQTYGFRIEAANAAREVVYAASCAVTAAGGVKRLATCSALSSKGALTVDLDALLASKGLACGAGAAWFLATLAGDGGGQAETLQSGLLPCDASAVFSPLAPGAYSGDVEVRDADGTTVAAGTCSGDVRPGTTSLAVCTASP